MASTASGALRPRGRLRMVTTGGQRSRRRRPGQTRRAVAIRSAQIGVLAALIGLWALSVNQGWVYHLYTASPGSTFRTMFHLFGTAAFWTNFRVTMYETAMGWLIGAVAGLVVGLALGRWRTVASVFDPYLTFANAMPKIALAPFFILWFGVGTSSKIVLAVTIVFFIVEVPTQAAARQIDPDLVLVVETMAATHLQQFRKVVVPSLVPTIFGALRLGAVYALLSVVLGEFVAAKLGLGQALLTSTNNFDMPTAFALLIVLALLAVIINGLLGLVERRLLRWQDVAQGRGRATAVQPTAQAA